MAEKPSFENAPGHIVRAYGRGAWEVRWQARTDLIKRDFKPKSVSVWAGTEPTDTERAMISERCKDLQTTMLVWSRGGTPTAQSKFNGSMQSLIDCYLSDPDSSYHDQRFGSRRTTRSFLRRIGADLGDELVSDINARVIKQQHKDWTATGHVAMGHGLVGRMSTLFGFGATVLENVECERLCAVMAKLRFPTPEKRTSIMTAPQAVAVREISHKCGLHSVAIAQAFQFECMLRQRDVIGEWVPASEPGMSDLMHDGHKWLRGIRWSEIDGNLILTHVTSKKGKKLTIDLKLSPMIMEEFRDFIVRDLWDPTPIDAEGNYAPMPVILSFTRSQLPSAGPVIVYEGTGYPHTAVHFRRLWRKMARMVGVPDSVFNMDSRAGAISEATNAGADLEHVRHAATHSNIATTQGYSRASEEKVAGVQTKRNAHRNKGGTEQG